MSRLRRTCAWPCRKHASPRARFWTAEALEAFGAMALVVVLGGFAVFALTH